MLTRDWLAIQAALAKAPLLAKDRTLSTPEFWYHAGMAYGDADPEEEILKAQAYLVANHRPHGELADWMLKWLKRTHGDYRA